MDDDVGQNPLRMYTALMATLEAEIGVERLGRLFLQVRTVGAIDPLPLAADPAVRGFAARLGLVPKGARAEAAGKRAEEWVRWLAESNQRSAVQVSLAVRLFASGLPGYLDPPVCGATPRCRVCRLTRDCVFHNEPPRPIQDRAPLHQRLLRDGAVALSDEELLAVLAGGSRVGMSEREWAAKLLRRYGTLRALFSAAPFELAGLRGMTPAAAARLVAAGALLDRRLAARREDGPQIRASCDFYDLYHAGLRDRKQEVMMVVMLDHHNRVFADEIVAMGTIDRVMTHPREVFRPAIRAAAASVAVLHNHPSGDATPSDKDYRLVKRLAYAAHCLSVPLTDAIVVGEGGYFSFSDEGDLPAKEELDAMERLIGGEAP